jgi:3'(2'), 5'-bisphosphate nucleotidase
MPTLDAKACAAMLEPLTDIAVAAADAILATRGSGGVSIKADGSPVTAADQAAEAVIRDGLRRHWPALPVVSEETEADRPVVERGSYVLVDPLDGTRDFIAGCDEYTVNIAVMTDREPILGVIVAPSAGLTWRGIVGRGAERRGPTDGEGGGRFLPIHTRPRPHNGLTVMVSRSHLEARTQAYVGGLPEIKLIACGSSIKFCRLAEGSADHYPRLAPTRDWDLAAGHAILSAAGGRVISPDGAPLAYGTADLLIPAFLAWGAAANGS